MVNLGKLKISQYYCISLGLVKEHIYYCEQRSKLQTVIFICIFPRKAFKNILPLMRNVEGTIVSTFFAAHSK